MRNLATLSDSIGGNLTGAGFALETIANLLGADGSEHFLNKDHINDLVHAVLGNLGLRRRRRLRLV